MLKLTRKLEYALIALRHMQMKGDTLSSTKEIADMYTIPREILAKTLQQIELSLSLPELYQYDILPWVLAQHQYILVAPFVGGF